MAIWIQHGIWSNRFKTALLVALFPVILWIAVFLFFYWTTSSYETADRTITTPTGNEKFIEAAYLTWELFSILGPVLIIWLLISFFYERKILFHFTGARPITRKENPMIYNIVENLCISRWLPVPHIGIIEEPWMNAFALWRREKDSWICFTQGLIDNLEPKEIEAVAGHELTHIMNKDTLLMLVMVLYIGAITTIGQILLRSSSSSSSKKSGWIPIIGLIFIIIGYAFYPLIRLAVSRRREYLADAWSVMLTKDNQAMISALKKISKKPEVYVSNTQVAALFTVNPLDDILEIFQTHPSIENRIKALESY